jgi:membrane-bound metal-dependent hydrolase YbcI (DUF457 family)
MILWFAGTAFATVWAVFKDPAIDYRLIMAGALVPDLVDVWTGGRGVGHTVLFSIALLTIVMLTTRRHRLARRRLLAVPIGTFLHLVFDGMWADRATFWWPAFGTSFKGALPSVARGGFDVVLELIGLALLVWGWKRFRLGEPARRQQFLRSGRFGRDLADRPRW